MFCPSCKAEYRQGFTHCADCDVELVPALPLEEVAVLPELPPIKGEALELLYEGPNETECKAAATALRRAEIAFNLKRSEGPPVIVAEGAPIYSLWVSPSDLEAAQELVTQVLGPQPTKEELDQLELRAAEVDGEMEDRGPEEIPDDWDPETATTEVWSGTDSNMEETLVMCLRENGIPSRAVEEDGARRRLLVRLEDEARAREILREIVDATPPE
jgi:hypothetical protein